MDLKAGLEQRTWQGKAPCEKGGFRGISISYKSPLPPFRKGGLINLLFPGYLNYETDHQVSALGLERLLLPVRAELPLTAKGLMLIIY